MELKKESAYTQFAKRHNNLGLLVDCKGVLGTERGLVHLFQQLLSGLSYATVVNFGYLLPEVRHFVCLSTQLCISLS